MDDYQCEKVYEAWSKKYEGKILVKGEMVDIIDIEEDAHLGWVCIIEGCFEILLSLVDPNDIFI